MQLSELRVSHSWTIAKSPNRQCIAENHGSPENGPTYMYGHGGNTYGAQSQADCFPCPLGHSCSLGATCPTPCLSGAPKRASTVPLTRKSG